jgi:hypothetical protein
MSTIPLREIAWPVFRLGERKPTIENDLVFYSAAYEVEDQAAVSFRLVDDKSVDKPTLGQRRLVLAQTENLYNIRTAIYFLVDLIKLARPTTWFIDSSGRVFQYKKSGRAKLRTYKLKQVLPAAGMGCVVEVEGLSVRFKSIVRPGIDTRYVGILSFNNVHLLYGFFNEPIKDSWRKV